MSFPFISTLKENILLFADLTSSQSCILLTFNKCNKHLSVPTVQESYLRGLKKNTDFQGCKPKKEVSPKPLHYIKS